MLTAAQGSAPADRSTIYDDDVVTANAVTRVNTGWALEPDRWATAEDRRRKLRAQSDTLADLLETAGVTSRLPSDVVSISAVTGIVTPLNPYRPIRIIPLVAARDRRPMLNALRYWIDEECTRPDHLRYGVITASERVPAYGDLRRVLQTLHRDISRWASEAYATYGIRVQFRGTEFTRRSASERGMDDHAPDQMIYHPHANVLMQPMRRLPKEGKGSWAEFLSWTWRELGSHWQDCGMVKNPAEIVKYVIKPDELRDLTPAEAKWLHESLYRINLAQPMGEYKLWWSALQDSRGKVVRIRAGEGSRLVIVQRPQRSDPATCAAGTAPDDCQVAPSGAPGPGDDPSPENILIGTTLPMWQHTPWAEPALLVRHYNPRSMSRAAHERLAEIRVEQMAARDLWDRAGAPAPETALQIAKAWREEGARSNVVALRARTRDVLRTDKARAPYRVHTCSLTVPAQTGSDEDDPPPDMRYDDNYVEKLALQPVCSS